MKASIVVFLTAALCLLVKTISQSTKISWKSTIAHDKGCYTQGFSFINSTHLLESCGLNHQSYFQIYEFKYSRSSLELNLAYKSLVPFEPNVFLQGSVVFPKNNIIYILTWLDHKVFRINAQTFENLQPLYWANQGWGLTHNGTHMFVSDGSSTIYVVDQSFKVIGSRQIIDQTGRAVPQLNQLQWVNQASGRQVIYANIYTTRRIIKINFETGRVVHQFDGQHLISNEKGLKYDEVINGIAYNAESKLFLLTGKKWSNIYQANFE